MTESLHRLLQQLRPEQVPDNNRNDQDGDQDHNRNDQDDNRNNQNGNNSNQDL